MKIDDIDRQIIRLTQAGLPLTPQPYHAVAQQLGVSADQVMQRMNALLHNGVIRRIGAVPNHYNLGYRRNGMTVWDIDDVHIDEVGRKIGRLDFVSHCYHRPRRLPDWPYNLFAMVHGKTEAAVREQIAQIAAIAGPYCRGSDVLFSTRILKKTGLRIGV